MRRRRARPETDRSPATAYADAIRQLARRPRTEAELRRHLQREGYDPETIEQVVERLTHERYVDDRELAMQYISARSSRLGHGPERLIDDLERRGVERDLARAAWRTACEQEGLADADELLRRQVAKRLKPYTTGLDARAYARVYNALLRAGFEGTAIYAALAPHRSAPEPCDPDTIEESQDDFP